MTTMTTRTAHVLVAVLMATLAGIGVTQAAASTHTGQTTSVEAGGKCRYC
jgi:hypothetical protein